MLLSVLIPVYKRYPAALLHALEAELAALAVESEVLVFDDSADPFFFEWHVAFTSHPLISIHYDAENLGRSAVRNRLMDLAKGQWLLFLDGDMLIPPNFLANYLQAAQTEAVFCGGIVSAGQGQGLRACYSKAVEEKSAEIRQAHPHRSFSAANFLMPANIKDRIRFPAWHTGYGHEDTHFGLQLLEAGIQVQHLDNAAQHEGFDSDEVFLAKSKEAVKNLVQMYRADALVAKHANHIRLIRNWHLARNLGLMLFILPFATYFEKRLKNGRCALRMFALLKLCWFERFYRLG